MKVALIGPTHPFRGGISHYTTLLYRYLKKRHDTLFVSFTRQYPQWLFPGKTDIDPSLSHIHEPGAMSLLDSMNPFSWFRSARMVVTQGPDLVIIPWWVSFWAPQFWTITTLIKHYSDAQIVFLCHNVVEHESGWIDKMITRLVLRKGDRFIVHSNDDLINLKTIIPDAVVKKTYHPTYNVFDRICHDDKKIRGRYSLQGKILLFFGFVRPYKGLKYLINALPDIIKFHDVTLMVVGEFWKDKEEYNSKVKKLGLENRVIFVDKYIPNEEVGDYFHAADLVVQPYTSATGSGVVQTAFGFGKPVLATRVGCLPEVIEHGKTGLLVEARSDEAISAAVVEFFNLSNPQFFTKNIEKQNHRFSWDKMIDVVENIL